MTQKIRYYKQDGTEYDFSKTPQIRISQTSNADMNIGVQKQKTAIEWLQEQLKNGVNFNPLDPLSYAVAVDKIFDDAKEKEKDQIREAYIQGHYDSSLDIYNPSECYYELFKKNQ